MNMNRAYTRRQGPMNRRPSRISRTTITMIVAALVLGIAHNAGAQSSTIDFSTPADTSNAHWISGFGGGMGWYSYSWGPLNQTVFDTLFGLDSTDTSKLGLNLLRITVDPAGQAYDAQYNVSPYHDGYGWDGEASYAYQAEQDGALVMATVITPLCNETTCYTSDKSEFGGSLATSHYADFGNWLGSGSGGYINYLANLPNAVTLTGISLSNEPNHGATAFGNTDWTASEFDSWLKNGDGAPITDANVRIMMPEAYDFDPTLADTALADSTASNYIGVVDGHCYGNKSSPALDPYATTLGIPEWQTECGDGEGEDHTQTWAEGLNEAAWIVDWMNAGYNGWLWWNAIDAGPAPNDHFNFDDGFVNYTDCDATACTNAIEPEGAAMGQFSEWARPGYMSVSTTKSGLTGVSAFQGGGNFVIVAVNNSSSPANATFTVQNATISSFNVYESYDNTTSNPPSDTACGTGSGYITCLAAGSPSSVSVSGGQFTYSLPKWSVVTFVGTGVMTAQSMLPNPRFATGDLAGWAVYVSPGDGSASDVTVPIDTSFSGNRFTMHESGTNFAGWARNIVAIPKGDTFTFTTWAKSNTTKGYVQLLENGTSTNLCNSGTNIAIGNTGSTWTAYTCSATMPTTGSGQVLIRLATSSLASGDEVDYADTYISNIAP